MGRTLLAFAVSPLAVPITFAALGTEIMGTGILLIYGYVFEMLLGLPTLLVFRHYRISSLPNFACWGGLIGLVSYFVLLVMYGEFSIAVASMLSGSLVGPMSSFALVCMLSGALAAAIFGSIVPRGSIRETSN